MPQGSQLDVITVAVARRHHHRAVPQPLDRGLCKSGSPNGYKYPCHSHYPHMPRRQAGGVVVVLDTVQPGEKIIDGKLLNVPQQCAKIQTLLPNHAAQIVSKKINVLISDSRSITRNTTNATTADKSEKKKDNSQSKNAAAGKSCRWKKFIVMQYTMSKAIIKSEIDSELDLLDALSVPADSKLSMKGIFIDNYDVGSCIGPSRGGEDGFLCEAANKCMISPNLGGKSWISEAWSLEYFAQRFHAKSFILETEVVYNYFNWKAVDFVCSIHKRRVGVSVTRAMCRDGPSKFTTEDAYVLLTKKLSGLLLARTNVDERQAFNVCFLHIWCPTREIADKLNSVYDRVIAEDDTNTLQEAIVLATVCTTKSIYTNKLS